jgi:hypothetical protein
VKEDEINSSYSRNGVEEEYIYDNGGKARRDQQENQDEDGWVLKLTLDRMGWYGLGRSGSGSRPVKGSCEHGNEPSGSCEHGNEPSGSIKC